MRFKRFLVGATLFTFLSTFGQQTDIDQVTVFGKFLNLPYQKISENIEVLTRKQIDALPVQSLDDLLAFISGVDIRKRGPGDVQADVSIRGSSFDQVLLLVNGVRMSDAQTGHNMLNLPFSLDAVEKIEVIKGPAARRFGQNAYAGVVNIVTKTSGENDYSVLATAGDFSTWSLGAKSDFNIGRSSNLISVRNSSSEGYRYNTDYKIHDLWVQNQLKLRHGRLKFQAGFVGKRFGANGFYATPEAKDQYEETQTSLVSAIYQQQMKRIAINANVYWRRAQDLYLYLRQDPSFYRNLHIGNNYGGELNLSFHSKLGVTGVGVELHEEDLRSNNLGSHGRFVAQLLAEHHFSLLQGRMQLIPGFSLVNYPGTGRFFYPGLDIGYNFDAFNKIYGNVALVHRVPTYTDLYYVSRTEEGNPDLKPESALSYEIGYRFQKRLSSFKTSLFGRDSRNAIDWSRNDIHSIWTAGNISHIKLVGAEMEVAKQFAGFVRMVSASYTYLYNHAGGKGQNSRYALESLRHQLNVTLVLQYQRFRSALVYQYYNRMNLDNYQLLDGKLSYEDDKFDLFVLINNIIGSRYVGANLVPMPGRWFQLGVKFKGWD